MDLMKIVDLAKIKNFVTRNEDKIGHCVINILIMLMCIFPWYVCLAVAIFASVGKELYDKYYKHTLFDIKDLLSDAVGIVIGFLLLLFFR